MPAPKGHERYGGRQPGSKNKATLHIKELLDECVDWNVLVGKLIELSNGISVIKTNERGQQKVYDNPPDSHAAKILLEYRFGKPSQSVELTGKDGKDLQVTVTGMTIK